MPSKTSKQRIAIALGVVIAGGAIAYFALQPVPPRAAVGMVRATEVKIMPEVSGRIAELPLKRGDRVEAGAVIARLSNPELVAAEGEAEAALLEAKAARDRVYAGVRKEEVGISAKDIDKANADLALAQKQFARISKLAADGYASKQQLDKATAAVANATAVLKSAKSQHQAAETGPTVEERAVADSRVAVAAAALAVLQRRVEKLVIHAPTAGMVETVVGELGEATVPGRTLLTVAAAGAPWFSFNLREDQLQGLQVGSNLTLTDAGAKMNIAARVTELRRLGDFATWRAARAVGDHDLNTFFIRADATQEGLELEPGVTVWMREPKD
jgi:multidrug resistance efflux pump